MKAGFLEIRHILHQDSVKLSALAMSGFHDAAVVASHPRESMIKPILQRFMRSMSSRA